MMNAKFCHATLTSISGTSNGGSDSPKCRNALLAINVRRVSVRANAIAAAQASGNLLVETANANVAASNK